MLAKLFSRRDRGAAVFPRVPDGRRLYAIGDVHGRLDLLDGLLAQIAADERARGGPAGELIFLGDLVDRGPDSAGVIDRLIALAVARPGTRFLTGNHEEVFLQALTGETGALRFFCRIGGIETILSYGIARDAYDRADYTDLAEMLAAAVPETHKRFLATFEEMIVAGDYAFVHAGVRPGVPLAMQRLQDLRWIRDEFLSVRDAFEKVIVYGHTIVDAIEQRPNRIALDTGAFRSGILSAMGFEGDDRWVLQQRGPQGAVAAA